MLKSQKHRGFDEINTVSHVFVIFFINVFFKIVELQHKSHIRPASRAGSCEASFFRVPVD